MFHRMYSLLLFRSHMYTNIPKKIIYVAYDVSSLFVFMLKPRALDKRDRQIKKSIEQPYCGYDIDFISSENSVFAFCNNLQIVY